MSNVNATTTVKGNAFRSVMVEEAFRLGYEGARNGEAINYRVLDRMTQAQAINYEAGRLTVLEGRRVDLEPPPYRQLSKRRSTSRYDEFGILETVAPLPSIVAYRKRVIQRVRLDGLALLPRRNTHQPAEIATVL